MNYEDVQKVSNAAKAKSNLVNTNFFKYFIRAVMAGFFIDVAMIYSNVRRCPPPGRAGGPACRRAGGSAPEIPEIEHRVYAGRGCCAGLGAGAPTH